MKKFFLSLAILLSAISVMAQGECEVKGSNFSRLELTFKAKSLLNSEAVTVKGHEFTDVTMAGFDHSSRIGCPSLPTLRKMIEIPLCDGISVTVVGERHTIVDGESLGVVRQVMPVQPSESKTQGRNRDMLVINQEIYNTDAFCGLDVVTTQKVGVARDRNLAQVVFSPVRYNPVTNQFMIYTEVDVVLTYLNPDVTATKEMKQLHYSPAFGSGIETINSLGLAKNPTLSSPMRYIIVSHPMFRGELDEFVNWKKRTGFIVDEMYTDNAEIGNTVSSIAAYLKRQYTEATAERPAPAFVLLVGDLEQLPAYEHSSTLVIIPGWWEEENTHYSDLPYSCWTDGDSIPDCYYGRLSAQTVEQLRPQLQKTLLYERYEFPDPSFLDVAVLVAGQDQGSAGDNGYKVCDPTMDYIAKFYMNGDNGYANVYEYKNNTSINPGASNVSVEPSASSVAAIRAKYSEGAGWINYSAHGDWDRWHGPELTTTQVAQMTNEKKCGIMIGNCCLSGKFDETTCFAESLLRKDNYSGAVAYIGASNSTYWNQDFYWSVGMRNSISDNMTHEYMADNLGMYDRLFHTHDEAYSVWAPTVGAMMFSGNMAVENSSSEDGDKLYYWEIYHTFGDPSLMPWLTQADDMAVTCNGLHVGSTSVSVSCVPYAYVAITSEDNTLVGAAFANGDGNATINTAQPLTEENYTLAVTAQNYKPVLTTSRQLGIGNADATLSDAKIYPNPMSNLFVVEADGLQKIEVIDAVGRIVITNAAGNTVDMSKYANGIYTVRITAGGITTLKKVVKK